MRERIQLCVGYHSCAKPSSTIWRIRDVPAGGALCSKLDGNVVAGCRFAEAWDNHHRVAGARHSFDTPFVAPLVRGWEWACSRGASAGSVVAYLAALVAEADVVGWALRENRLGFDHRRRSRRCQRAPVRSNKPLANEQIS